MTDRYDTAVTCWQCYAATFSLMLLVIPGQSTCIEQMGGTAVAARDKLCFLVTGVVKMRRGQVASFMLQVQTMKDVYLIFHQFATTIATK